jgi:hypothetical protein
MAGSRIKVEQLKNILTGTDPVVELGASETV